MNLKNMFISYFARKENDKEKCAIKLSDGRTDRIL